MTGRMLAFLTRVFRVLREFRDSDTFRVFRAFRDSDRPRDSESRNTRKTQKTRKIQECFCVRRDVF